MDFQNPQNITIITTRSMMMVMMRERRSPKTSNAGVRKYEEEEDISDDNMDQELSVEMERFHDIEFKNKHKRLMAGGGGGGSSSGSGGGVRRVGGRGGGRSSCQAENCMADMTEAKRYHRRHKVCEFHAKAPSVLVSGLPQRFCQQCSRFHELSKFDETKRSCRRRLAGHNERRRKSLTESIGSSSHPKSGLAEQESAASIASDNLSWAS